MNKNYTVKRFHSHIDINEIIDNYFDFDTTYERCKACSGFAGTWSCPSYSFDTKRYFEKFNKLHLIVDRVSNEGCTSLAEAENRLSAEKKVFDKEMRNLEKKHFGNTALAAQECVNCDPCNRKLGEPCSHPEVMRYSLESLGVITTKLIKDKFDFEILWSEGNDVPEYYVLVGGLLER